MDTTINPILLTEKQAVAALNIAPRTLSRLTSSGRVPSVKIGRLRRYPRRQLLEWVEQEILGTETIDDDDGLEQPEN